MKKNSHLHIVIESEVLSQLNDEASTKGIRLSEVCRQKLRKNSQMDRIEKMLAFIIEILKNGRYNK